jgi:hypothetical protein
MRARALLAAVAAATSVSAIAVAAEGGGPTPVTYEGTAGSTVGLRPTGVGLPNVGAHGTFGVSEYVTAVRAYHDSGAYDRDLAAVAAAARAYLEQRLADAEAPPVLECRVRYKRTARRLRGRPLYRRKQVCRERLPERIAGKPAMVLDIDETSLSNYAGLDATNFTGAGLVPGAATGTSPAIAATLELYRYARERGVAVFFITGRPEIARIPTEANLRGVGYTQWDGLTFKPSRLETVEYKAGERRKISEQGFDILLNVGDQESDLAGGHADRAVKLPNPFYFISD